MWLNRRTWSTVFNCNGYDCKYANIHIAVNDYDQRLVSIPMSRFSSNLGRYLYTVSSISTVMSRICHTILMRLRDVSFFHYSPWICSRPRESFRLIAKRISIMLSDNAHDEDYCYHKLSSSSHVLEMYRALKRWLSKYRFFRKPFSLEIVLWGLQETTPFTILLLTAQVMVNTLLLWITIYILSPVKIWEDPP